MKLSIIRKKSKKFLNVIIKYFIKYKPYLISSISSKYSKIRNNKYAIIIVGRSKKIFLKGKKLITKKIDVLFFDDQFTDEALLPPPPIWSRLIIWTLGSGTIILLVWSVVFKVEETIVLPGEISTRHPEVQIAALDPGRVIAVFVEPYQFVKKGEKILLYSDDETPLRLKSLLLRRDLILSDIKKAKSINNIKEKKIQANIDLNSLVLKNISPLVEEGAISKIEYLDRAMDLQQNELELESNKQEFIQILNSLKKNLEEIDISIAELNLKLNRFVIKSSLDGFIQSLKYQTEGELIQPGEVVVTIVPDMDLIAKVDIPSKLSAPVDLSSTAVLDIDAFPSSDYGSIEASVSSISPMSSSNSQDSPQRTYQAFLKLNKPQDPSKLSLDDLRPGMGLSARLKLREKPLISTVFTFVEDVFQPLSENR